MTAKLHGNTKTGMSHTRVYVSWRGMIRRCTSPRCARYKYYGGKGIKFQASWGKFENFFKDMGHPPSKAHSLDRIDSELDYTMENCRWATAKEQANNRTNSLYFEYKGSLKTIPQLSEELGVPEHTLRYRLRRKSETLSAALLAIQAKGA